ncbi:MAG: cardiolipin synthase [Thermodesulfobacteriota bacterium]
MLALPWGYILTVVTTIGGYLLTLVLIPRILLDRRGAEATVAWILLIAFLPYLGAALYYLFGRTRIRRRRRKMARARAAFQESLNRLPEISGLPDDLFDLSVLPKTARALALTAGRLAENAPMPGNRVEVFIDGRPAYESMEEAILTARRHISLMSYIYRPDQTGAHFRDLLAQKAGEGVEVRLLVDSFGAFHLGTSFIKPLIKAGGRFARFSPVLAWRSHWRANLRNHRKILVVDGRVGFTGGLNIGDEYQGRRKRFAPWRDTHLRLEGPAVRDLLEIFAEDWFFASDEDLAYPEHFPEVSPCGPELVQVIGSGPDYDYEIIHQVFFTAINAARKSIYITTPYFVPSPAVLMALKSAVWRGVDVQILLPGRSDMPLVQLAGRSFYEELLEAGIRVYHHRPGILHAKTMVVDGAWCTIGSANMDVRSFKLNFEVNVLVWGESLARRLEEIFRQDLVNAEAISDNYLENRSRGARMAEAVGRALAPVL